MYVKVLRSGRKEEELQNELQVDLPRRVLRLPPKEPALGFLARLASRSPGELGFDPNLRLREPVSHQPPQQESERSQSRLSARCG